MNDVREQFGDIDIYVFDQILRGRIAPGMRIIDAGCGGGRNILYLLRNGYDVAGCDRDHHAVEAVRALSSRVAAHLPGGNFRVEPIEAMSFPDACADVVLASAVLHFAADEAQFEGMVKELWRVLKPGGMLFARLASTIGMESRVVPVRGRVHRLPDGSERYLVNEEVLVDLAARLGGELLDPIKTTVVQDQRAMTTWVVRKGVDGT
jgi:tellurite methyltransferase